MNNWEQLRSYIAKMGSHSLTKEEDHKKQMKARMKKYGPSKETNK